MALCQIRLQWRLIAGARLSNGRTGERENGRTGARRCTGGDSGAQSRTATERDTCSELAQNLLRTCSELAQNLLRTCSELAQNAIKSMKYRTRTETTTVRVIYEEEAASIPPEASAILPSFRSLDTAVSR